MKIGKWLVAGLVLLPLAELIAFLIVSALFGVSGAAVLLIAGSGAGVLILYQRGPRWLQDVRDLLSGRFAAQGSERTVPAIPALAAVLLAIPGFLTDLAALLVLVPSVRTRLDALLGTGGPPGAPDPAFTRRRHPSAGPVVDLAPDEWEVLPEPKRRRRARRDPKT
ncbi:FxsA family protein [Rhodoplanes sp. SY1]|uniref:FxsA family protein n=1 Tax=Rhodoplanes sp. SY1 TaxID=3166646 RepID=UPI0038B5E423